MQVDSTNAPNNLFENGSNAWHQRPSGEVVPTMRNRLHHEATAAPTAPGRHHITHSKHTLGLTRTGPRVDLLSTSRWRLNEVSPHNRLQHVVSAGTVSTASGPATGHRQPVGSRRTICLDRRNVALGCAPMERRAHQHQGVIIFLRADHLHAWDRKASWAVQVLGGPTRTAPACTNEVSASTTTLARTPDPCRHVLNWGASTA